MRPALLLPAAALALGLGGCAGMNDTQQRTLTGGAGGAAGGAIIGALAGNAGLGALIGAGVGAGGGYLYDQHKQGEQRAYSQGYQQGRSRTY
jgi:osmotically inducible lipoprotein OsmB